MFYANIEQDLEIFLLKKVNEMRKINFYKIIIYLFYSFIFLRNFNLVFEYIYFFLKSKPKMQIAKMIFTVLITVGRECAYDLLS